MSSYKMVMAVAVVCSLGLLLPAGPVAAGDCGFNLPCEQTVTTSGAGLSIFNNLNELANASAIQGQAVRGVGVLGISDFFYGVCGQSASTGVFGTSTGGRDAIVGLTNSDISRESAGVLGRNYGYGPGVMGKGDKREGVYGDGLGYGVRGKHTGGAGAGVYGESGASFGVLGTSGNWNAGFFTIANTANANAALKAQTAGSGDGVYATSAKGRAGYFKITNSANASTAMRADTAGTGWAGAFYGTGAASRGVYISTKPGTKALQVAGGTKSAVVPTSKGARALYAEEASEVYFTDYGFGKLQDGKAVIKIDPLFAETVNVKEPYHVFVQAYGKAELYVSKRNSNSFEVAVNNGDGNVEFSYRLVAKRQGFETARLEHAPWADKDPNLYPEELTDKVAALIMP